MNEKSSQSVNKKKLKIRTNNKSYSIKDSSLYNLTKNSLEKQLGCTLLHLETLRSDDNYRVFMVDDREIQCPKFQLNKIHTRIASLLCRIEMPDFLQSYSQIWCMANQAASCSTLIPSLNFTPSMTSANRL